MPTVTAYSISSDNYISSTNSTYTTARAGSGIFSVGTATISTMTVGQAGTYTCYEGFVDFPTSTASVIDTITSVTLTFNVTANTLSGDVINARVFDWGTSVTSADWIAGANIGNYTLVASSGFSGTGSFALTGNDAFIASINKAGSSRYILTSGNFENAVSTAGSVTVSSGDSGTGTAPKLTITGVTTYPFSFTAAARIKAPSYKKALTAAARIVPATRTKTATADATTGTVLVTAYNPFDATCVAVNIYRAGTLIRSSSINTTWTDYAAPLNTATTYTIDELTSGGTVVNTTTVTGVTVVADEWFLSGSFGSLVVTPSEASSARTLQTEDFMVLNESYKVVQQGLLLGRQGSLTAQVISSDRDAKVAAIRSAVASAVTVYLKDPWGGVYPVVLGEVEIAYQPGGHVSLTIPYVQVD